MTKFDKTKKATSKKLSMTSCQQIATPLSFYQFMANLEQSRSRILEPQSVKLTSSLITTFYLTKTAKRTKKSLTQLSHYCFQQRSIMPKNADFLQKKADISKIQRVLVLKGMFSETIFVWVVTYQISSSQHNSNEFQTGGGSFTPSPSKQTSKKPTQIRAKR